MAIWTNYTSKSTPADNDTLLEYDATGRALKQTPFSGVYNWLQAKIHALTASAGAWAASTDKLLTDRNGTLSRIDYSVLAKAIVEEYTGSSVAGANQAIKTALDSLNSNVNSLDAKIGSKIYKVPSGDSIINAIKSNNVSEGISFISVRNATDNPVGANVAYAIVVKASMASPYAQVIVIALGALYFASTITPNTETITWRQVSYVNS